MDADFSKSNLRRRPQWRADRVVELVSHPKLQLQQTDDKYVRSHRRFRIRQMAAGNDETKLFDAFLADPHSSIADTIYFAREQEFRHVLEARLMSAESLAQIASRVEMEEKSVAHYAAMFFDVRDRLQNTDWRHEVILGPSGNLLARLNGIMCDTQRAFLYRLFASYGGPAVLDSVIQSIGPRTLPERRESSNPWVDSAAEQIVRTLFSIKTALCSYWTSRWGRHEQPELAKRPADSRRVSSRGWRRGSSLD